ncbi:hypothetical protein Gogos_000231 [Gossypium gossypioides]|uniref:Uncharacterized protein n=1 Tax=Gossypium gossypioides TaxID=34282 RepID=A0A7J9CSG0_GOSGO|nr:hypothetical protein [Gossypium gossypioides]
MSSHNTHSSVGGGREDCWSEGTTATLIKAWGDRFSRLDRRKLRQNDLQEVVDPVNSRILSLVQSMESHRWLEDVGLSNEASFSELARAILKFREIYERINSWKQHQMMELEKQRIEFTEDVEFQRMNMLVDAQLEMENFLGCFFIRFWLQ